MVTPMIRHRAISLRLISYYSVNISRTDLDVLEDNSEDDDDDGGSGSAS